MEYSFMHKIVVPNTILIVDDDEMNRDVLGNIFSASHSIEMAENGNECLNKILKCGQKILCCPYGCGHACNGRS